MENQLKRKRAQSDRGKDRDSSGRKTKAKATAKPSAPETERPRGTDRETERNREKESAVPASPVPPLLQLLPERYTETVRSSESEEEGERSPLFELYNITPTCGEVWSLDD